MPKAYCQCCQKQTAHKVVMKRCQDEHSSVFKNIQCFFSTLIQGDHYVKMERTYFCRSCNHQTLSAGVNFSNIKAA
ncbi:hypothetical protein ACQEXU_10645 [Vibrio sp. TRT 21S02]|uniref:hypothetical protein n=1 Tax=unclassified Vibrio TaxID=2614977 RepID=UPI00349F6FC5